MTTNVFSVKKALLLYGSTLSAETVASGELSGRLPAFPKINGRQRKTWTLEELPEVGERIGFMRKPAQPIALSVFVTKGGVLKTSLTLNLARMAALHNIRTCVVGLDMQGDISTALGFNSDLEQNENLDSAIEQVNATRGLADYFAGDASLDDILVPTDIPTLYFIPETPELVALDQSLINKNRREYWLKEKVVDPLKEKFDLIIMDCSPNWNRLITNSLVACDLLVSPLECKINNFRNFKIFQALINEFRADLQSDFRHAFIPTRLSPARRLSSDIFKWYRDNLADCVPTAIRESIQGEEASAMHLSVPEYAPSSPAADEMRIAIKDIWSGLPEFTYTQIPQIDSGAMINEKEKYDGSDAREIG